MNDEKKTEVPVEILSEHLSVQALSGIIESFILREGTDYGQIEASYEKKEAQVRNQIELGKIKIIFDQVSETVSLLNEHDFKRLVRGRKE